MDTTLLNNQVVLFNHKKNLTLKDSRTLTRAIVRYVSIIWFISLGTFILFTFPNKISTEKQAIASTPKLFIILGILSLSILLLRVNQVSFNKRIFTEIMSLLSLGYSTFMAVYLRDFRIDNINELYKIFNYLWPILLIAIFWYGGISFLENKINPFLSKLMLWKTLMTSLLLSIVLLIYLFISTYTKLIPGPAKSFSLEKEDDFLFLCGLVMLVLGYVALFITRWFYFRKKGSTEYMTKNVTSSLALIIIIPMTLWYIIKYIVGPILLEDYLFIIFDLFAIGLVAWFAIVSKGTMSSPLVFSAIFAISILMIWSNKFVFEYIQSNLTKTWKTSINLLSISTVTIILFFKNNPLTRNQSFSMLSFIFMIGVYTLSEWLLAAWPQLRDDANKAISIIGNLTIDDTMNTTVLLGSISLLSSTIHTWYKTQSRANRILRIKLKKAMEGGINEA